MSGANPATGYGGDHTWGRTRTARKLHVCDWCGEHIPAGSLYAEYTSSPANEYFSGSWSRIKWHLRRDGRCVR